MDYIKKGEGSYFAETVDFPRFMHFVHTRTFWRLPSMITCLGCRFGANLRLDIPVVFSPTPPFDLGRPRLLIVDPDTARFPQYIQLLLIISL